MDQQVSRQNPTENNRFIDNSQLSKREQRIKEAVFLYYMEDMTQQEIADEIGVTRPTVSDYLNSDKAQYFEPIFSSKEQGELKRWLQDGIYHTFRESQEALKQIKNSNEAKPNTVTRAATEMVKNKERLINLLQEIQELEKPKERKEIEDNTGGPAEVNISMDLVEDDQSIEEEQEEEVEAQ